MPNHGQQCLSYRNQNQQNLYLGCPGNFRVLDIVLCKELGNAMKLAKHISGSALYRESQSPSEPIINASSFMASIVMMLHLICRSWIEL